MKTIFNNNQEQDDPLQKQFKTLELEWDSIKQSFSRSTRRTYSTGVGDHSPFNFSDKELMSFLQIENTPEKEAAVEVIEKTEPKFEEIDCFDMEDEESEVTTVFSCNGFEDHCNGFGAFRRPSCMESLPYDEAESGGMVVANGGGCGGEYKHIRVGKWFVSVVVMLFAIAIVAFECSSEHEHFLVPT
ncbi:hypothetical protein QVD17_02528 [Tagetes erecta]|uniref:Uncharacterized protein n=1 Tax=Tagetes erecta TaxID=13708 RepID=A0AAD8LCL7_TARER|nr:hypothetical protein QVD17_02528 [Tagetes erecta]